jgi:hypothetical protein
MEATMKTKIATDDDEEVQRFGRKTKKPQSDFMKQLTDLAQQVVELPPPPTPPTQTETITDEIRRQVNLILYLIIFIRFISLKETEVRPSLSPAGTRLARPVPLRRPPSMKPVAPTKPARIPVKQLVSSLDETIQTVETIRPREFSTGFLHFIDKLKEFHWFEEQYPLMKIDVCIIIFKF